MADNWPISGLTGVEPHDDKAHQEGMRVLGWVPAAERRPALEESVIVSYSNGYEVRAVVKHHFKNGSMRLKREGDKAMHNDGRWSVWTKKGTP